MALKTFGRLRYEAAENVWHITEVQPHVAIKLKSIFPKIPKHYTEFVMQNLPDVCHDLLWFLSRYPLRMTKNDLESLKQGREIYHAKNRKTEELLLPNYVPQQRSMRNGLLARNYQIVGAEFHAIQKRTLLVDDVGLGKTLTGILTFFHPGTLPALVIVQTHLPIQWKQLGIEKFTDFTCHIIDGTKPYDLPRADVYIMKYSCLSGWVDVFPTRFFKSAIFDEVQEMRRMESQKYQAATVLSENVDYCLGMSATPVYNYGDEIFAVLNMLNPGCLGEYWDFLREWATPIGKNKYKIKDAPALGSHLLENSLMLRRRRADVGRELPEVNKVIIPVDYDEKVVEESQELTRTLALKVVSGSFVERGQAARDLDALVRRETGIAKAKHVAAFVRMIIESGYPVLLSGWHRDVYDIWMLELNEFNPVMYTGSESPSAKEKAKAQFIAGESKVLIISNRSGIGLDGLQHHCHDVVIGELDWSPKVHDQIIGRVDRDGQKEPVSAYFPICEYGSDPFIVDTLGLKSSQSHGIVDPLLAASDQHSDESRIKALAQYFLNRKQ